MTANLQANKVEAVAARSRRRILGGALGAITLLASMPFGSMAEQAAPFSSVTHHRFKVGGADMAFTVTAATLALDDAPGERQAGIFYVAYVRDGAPRDSRPITFVFNGGPGASSAYLHLGALGPRIADFGLEGQLPQTPERLVDNPDNWLDLSDLVFIDPVGTGYSGPFDAGQEAGKRYWGVNSDLRATATFIEHYLDRNDRRVSPKYLVGESYGGFRAVLLARRLAENHRIDIAGSFLISPVLEFNLRYGDRFNILPDALRLPSYAAVALERSMTPTPAALAEVERFALGPYLSTLSNPRNNPALRKVYADTARHIGLSEMIVSAHDGRVPLEVFEKEIRRADQLRISRYDGSVAAGGDGDAVFKGLADVLPRAITPYLADTLGVRTDLPYRLSNGKAAGEWSWRDAQRGAATSMLITLQNNPAHRVVIAHGMTDLVTPYFVSRYVLDHLPLPTSRVTLNLYPGGHMMYLRAPTRARLHADAARLYATPPL